MFIFSLLVGEIENGELRLLIAALDRRTSSNMIIIHEIGLICGMSSFKFLILT
jgi:hypothetical protein